MNKMSYPGNLSHSSHSLYLDCQRRFFYSKILKLPESNNVESKYANFGQCVHQSIEKLHEHKSIEEAVKTYWMLNKLYNTDLNRTDAELNVAYAMNLKLDIKEYEMQIVTRHKNIVFKAIIDAVLTDGTLVDWKTSVYTKDKVEDYKKQLLFYSWIWHKKFNEIPKKCMIVFTRAQKTFEFGFNLQEIKKFEKELFSSIKEISDKTDFEEFKPNYNSCFFCAYKFKCSADDIAQKKSVSFVLSIDHDNIVIESKLPSWVNDVISKEFSYEVDNAHFVKKAMFAKGVKFNGVVNLYNKAHQKLPIGFMHDLVELLDLYSEHLNKTSLIKYNDKRLFNDKQFKLDKKEISMYDYQHDAVKHILKQKICFVEIATGGGKTRIAAELIRKTRFNTLFIVDRNVLVNQAKEAFEELLDIECGEIYSGKKKFKDVDVASVQTIMSLMKKDERFKLKLGNYNMIIVDEAHGAKSKSYKEIFKYVGAEYRVGLSGTAYADGNASLELYRTFGKPRFKLNANKLIQMGILTKPKIIFLEYEKEFIINGSYDEVYDQLLKSVGRMEQLNAVLEKHKDENILIMADRIEHLHMIKDIINKDSFVITGSVDENKREKILGTLRNEKGNILIATASIIQKGVDIPNLSVLINYTANLGSIKTIQSLGRVLRKSKDKDECYYYDFNDTHHTLKQHTKARKEQLISQGYEIEK